MQQHNGSQVHTNTEHTQHKTFLPFENKTSPPQVWWHHCVIKQST